MPALSELIGSFTQEEQEAFASLFARYRFTESQKLEIAKDEADLRQWKEPSFISAADYPSIDARKDGRKGDAFIAQLRAHMEALRSGETDYSGFNPIIHPRPKYRSVMTDKKVVLGRCPCPVDGEKTRCCRLVTMDPIEQCAFSCSYCSVQAFYSENEIHAVSSLKEKLLAARAAGIQKVLIPHDNEGDLDDLPAELKQDLQIIPIKTVDEVITHALGISMTQLQCTCKESKPKTKQVPLLERNRDSQHMPIM